MPHLDLGPLQIHYRIAGSGPPLVLIPGWTLNLHLWDEMAPFLEPHYRVIRYDPRGAGQSSSNPDLEYSRLSDAEDLAALLDHLGIAEAHLVGHSKGARIALIFAMKWPERVFSVAAIGSAEPHPEGSGASFRPIAAQWVAKAAKTAREEGPEAAVRNLGRARLFGTLRASPEGLRHLRLAMEGYAAADLLSEAPKRSCDTEAGASRLTMPILFLAGEEDPFLEECRYAHERLPSSRLAVLPRCGHMAPVERPRAVADTLQAFLSEEGLSTSGNAPR
ncbi:MAG: alpha/beta fold hydrolase [Acidobacteriota bacterium]